MGLLGVAFWHTIIVKGTQKSSRNTHLSWKTHNKVRKHTSKIKSTQIIKSTKKKDPSRLRYWHSKLLIITKFLLIEYALLIIVLGAS